jgi:hypothetical protein
MLECAIRVRRAILAALTLFVASSAASAEDAKRAKPDYDGRGDSPAPAGDAALWVPRVIFAPFYFTSEFLLRRPLGLLIPVAERNDWAATLINFFTFDKDHKTGLVPTAFFDFGFIASVGLYFFWDDMIVKNNDLVVHGSTGGGDWIALSGTDRFKLGKNSTVAVDLGWVHRPDYVFHGIGPRSLESDRGRFSTFTTTLGPRYDLKIGSAVRYQAKVGVKSVRFRDGHFGGDPTMLQQIAAGVYPTPSGFVDGYTAAYERMELAIDSRAPRPATQSGARASAHTEHGTDLAASVAQSWIRYGATLGGYWDVNDHQRVVSLVVNTEFADPLRGGEIPFTEQVVWGGMGDFSGYRPGRLVGRSAASASLNYEWPVWVWLDGTIHVAVGNVFDAGLKDFSTNLLRLSSSLGVRTSSSPDHQFEILFGVGSETFEHGAQITAFRLAIGGTNGF